MSETASDFISKDLDNDPLYKSLLAGTATAEDQRWAANWLRALHGLEMISSSAINDAMERLNAELPRILRGEERPSLTPALKYQDKIYKGPIGGQHLDAVPDSLHREFQRNAMSGEDISDFEFGFVDGKGQFLDREKALDYAIEHGLVDTDAGKHGALTSSLLSDSGRR